MGYTKLSVKIVYETLVISIFLIPNAISGAGAYGGKELAFYYFDHNQLSLAYLFATMGRGDPGNGKGRVFVGLLQISVCVNVAGKAEEANAVVLEGLESDEQITIFLTTRNKVMGKMARRAVKVYNSLVVLQGREEGEQH